MYSFTDMVKKCVELAMADPTLNEDVLNEHFSGMDMYELDEFVERNK